MAQHPNVKAKGTGSHLDQHPAVKQNKTGSHMDNHPSIKNKPSGSHLDQAPGVKVGNESGDHLSPSVKAGNIKKTAEKGGHSRDGHVKSSPAVNQKAGPKFVASRDC